MSQWASATGVAHILLGSLTALVAAPDNWHLRQLMLVLGFASAAALYLVLRRALRLRRGRALAGALILASNPLFLTLSASFQTDVSCLLFQIAALGAFLKSLDDDGTGWLAASSALLGAAFLCRQNAAFSAGGALLFLWRERRLGPRRAAALLLPVAATAAAYNGWFYLAHGATWAWTSGLQRPKLDAAALLSASSWARLLWRLDGSAQTSGLLLAALAAACLPALRRLRSPGRAQLAALAAVAAAALAGWALQGGLPLLPNTLHRRGLGVLTLNDPEAKFAGLWSLPALWRLADAAALASALILLRVLWERLAGSRGRLARAALFFGLPPFLVLLARPDNYDRYVLAAAPPVIIAASALLADSEFDLRLCGAACALLAFLSAVGLKDYFAWNRARWRAGVYAVGLGFRPDQVENGFDWDGQYSLERNMRVLLASRPPELIGNWDWMSLNRIVFLTSYSARPPRPDFKPAGRFAYATPLSADEQYVYLYRYAP